MTVEPMETCPSAAITTESRRRTQTTVVERMRRPSARSSGWASGVAAGGLREGLFPRPAAGCNDEETLFLRTSQYIAAAAGEPWTIRLRQTVLRRRDGLGYSLG